MKKYLKKIAFYSFIILLLVALWHFWLIIYGIRQGIGQLQIVWGAENPSIFLDNAKKHKIYHDTTLAKFKKNIQLIKEIKKFAVDSLGMKDAGNYEKIFDQKNKPLLWAVTACKPYSFEPYMWDYGFLGMMPYKGFFDSTSAKNLSKELEKQGYDTNIYSPAGWSTLGWFSDPVLSSMLYWDEGNLASLILHEMTHSTVWVTGDVEYNENFADFVGDIGAKLFLKRKFGENSKQITEYINNLNDSEKFYQYMLKSTNELENLYKTFDNNMADSTKARLKKEKIEEILDGFSKAGFANEAKVAKRMKKRKKLPNNAFFMNFRRYRAKQGNFQKEFEEKANGDLRKYILYLKK